MNFSQFVSQLGKTVNDNSPLILTGIGVGGVVTVALLTGKATIKATRLIDDVEFVPHVRPGSNKAEMARVEILTFKDKFKLVWPLYIPAAGTAALTITAVVMANRIGTRRAAAMAAAYAISQESFQEYREKIIEKIGEGKERKARDEIAQEHINRTDFSNVIVTGNGDVDFLDDYSGRPFRSTMEDVKHAVNKINNRINHQVYASLNDLYNELGLDNIPVGEEVGWTQQLVEPVFTTGVTKDNRPCFVIRFQVEPMRNYWQVHGKS